MNKDFLIRFVDVVESDHRFDVASKCKMASLITIVISSDMRYLTEVGNLYLSPFLISRPVFLASLSLSLCLSLLHSPTVSTIYLQE